MALKLPPFPKVAIIDGAAPTAGIYESTTDQRFQLGTRYELPDGRVFRYAKAGGTALVQAFMTQTAVQESKAVAILQTGHAQAVGTRDISILVTTGSALAVNAFSGGWLVANKVSPAVLGDIYSIEASELQSTDTILDLRLETPWRIAMLATGEVSLNFSRYFETVVVPATTITAPPAGVPLSPVPINSFYWSQTKGPAPLIIDTGDTVVIGGLVGIPATNAIAGTGGGATATLFSFPVFGTVMSIATAAEPCLVDLKLE